MVTVVSIEARAVSVPLEKATSLSTRKVFARHYLLVRIIDSDGNHGIGFCYAGSFGGTFVAEAVRQLIAPVVIGKDPRRTRMIWDLVYAETLLHGRAGSVMRALSAVDNALWDLNARRAGEPLWRFLSPAAVGDSVKAYASGGYYFEGSTPADVAAELRGYVDQGFDAVKMRVGLNSPEVDAERVAAAREAIGPSVQLMLDANNAWRDVPTALRSIRAFEPYDPFWIEEPFSPDDITSHAELATKTPITVATGEIEAGRWRARHLLEQRAAAILQTDAAVCGGITEYLRIASVAEAFAVPMAPHWFHDLHIHLVAAMANSMFVEFFPDDAVLNFRKLITEQLVLLPGSRLELPERPGLGFDFREDAVEDYAVDAWS